jgi:hypothetical protein
VATSGRFADGIPEAGRSYPASGKNLSGEAMTPASAINHILDGIDGIEIDADNDAAVETLLRAAVAIAGVALMRLEPHEREPLLAGLERGVRRYIGKVMALQEKRLSLPKVAHGSNGKGNAAGTGWPRDVIGCD